jgi:archaellum component FlaC
MDYSDIQNPKIKEIVDSLKHYSSTIENDVKQALDEAQNEDEFIEGAKSFLEGLHEEVESLFHELTQASEIPEEKVSQHCCDNQCGTTCPIQQGGWSPW